MRWRCGLGVVWESSPSLATTPGATLVLVDDGPHPDRSRLEDIADAAGVASWRLREWLEQEIERRRQEAAGCFTGLTGPRSDGARPSFPPQPRGAASDASRAARI